MTQEPSSKQTKIYTSGKMSIRNTLPHAIWWSSGQSTMELPAKFKEFMHERVLHGTKFIFQSRRLFWADLTCNDTTETCVCFTPVVAREPNLLLVLCYVITCFSSQHCQRASKMIMFQRKAAQKFWAYKFWMKFWCKAKGWKAPSSWRINQTELLEEGNVEDKHHDDVTSRLLFCRS